MGLSCLGAGGRYLDGLLLDDTGAGSVGTDCFGHVCCRIGVYCDLLRIRSSALHLSFDERELPHLGRRAQENCCQLYVPYNSYYDDNVWRQTTTSNTNSQAVTLIGGRLVEVLAPLSLRA
jgi:hypothetical protein